MGSDVGRARLRRADEPDSTVPQSGVADRPAARDGGSYNLCRQGGRNFAMKLAGFRGKPNESKNMNWKKRFFAFIAAWVFVFVYEWLFHVMFMKSNYMETAMLWRDHGGLKTHFPLPVLWHVRISFFFTLVL